MKYITARQMWHDAFSPYDEDRDPLAPRSFGKVDHDRAAWDQMLQGKVQHAIDNMKPLVRSFGMVMYAPTSFVQTTHLDLLLAYLLVRVGCKQFYVELEMPEDDKREAATNVIVAALNSVKHLQWHPLENAIAVLNDKNIAQQLEISVGEYREKWRPIFDSTRSELEKLTSKALGPLRAMKESMEDNTEVYKALAEFGTDAVAAFHTHWRDELIRAMSALAHRHGSALKKIGLEVGPATLVTCQATTPDCLLVQSLWFSHPGRARQKVLEITATEEGGAIRFKIDRP